MDVVRHEAALLAALQALGHQTPPPAAPPTAAAGAGVGTSNARPAVAAADVGGGLKHLDAAALAVPHCEAVFAARALALLRLGKWKEAVAVCDARVTQDEQVAAEDDSMPAGSWRHWVRAQVGLAGLLHLPCHAICMSEHHHASCFATRQQCCTLVAPV